MMGIGPVTARFLILILVAFLFASGCATTGGSQARDDQQESGTEVVKATRPSQAEIEAKVVEELKGLGEKELAAEEQQASEAREEPAQITYDIPITINEQVNYFLDYFQTRIPKRFKYWLARSGRYVPMMRDILKGYGLPEDLVYLAMIESGFSCRAYSRAHAVGPWQFIKGTGKRYGLKIDYWVDERRDPVKATHAAAKYLKDLYAEFNSWYLAAAAYNAGEAKIRRALSRYEADNFWDISHSKRNYLKRETKQYVPKMIAAALIAKEPAKYGFEDIVYDPPLAFEEVWVDSGTSLAVAAKLADVKSSEISDLNPELRRWSTPPDGRKYKLRLPSGKAQAFNTAYASLSPKDRIARPRAAKVTIGKGDTLGKIAKSFGVPLHDLIAMNPKLDSKRLRIGQEVFVPPSKESRIALASTPAVSKGKSANYEAPHRNQRKLVHVVKSGDTLWDIAQSYGLDYRDIQRWNGKRSHRLQRGQKLVLYMPQTKVEAKVQQPSTKSGSAITYKVRRGDTLWDIAKAYGLDYKDIKRWNGKRSSKLSQGQKLVLYVPQKTKTTQNTSSAEEKVITYEVRQGDNLWKIAKRFNVSTSALKRWNDMRSSRLNPGDKLKVKTADNS